MPVREPSEYQSAARSFHFGFALSINAFFRILVQPFNCFSRKIACSIRPYVSMWTRSVQLYRLVNPGIVFFLCCQILRSSELVTPMYKTFRHSFVRM